MVIIGAGLAGLRAAITLAEAGRHVVVLEASDRVGGRQRSDVVDGFTLDVGFHVLNPAYPAVRRGVDVVGLELSHFPVGVEVARGRTIARLAHPLRHPRTIPATLRSGLIRPRELVSLARWAMPTLLSPEAALRGPDRSLREGWNRAGVHGVLRHEVLEPFLAGVIADDEGETSDAFVKLLVRSFALGSPGIPRGGIGALPAQLLGRAVAAGATVHVSAAAASVRRAADGVEVGVHGGDTVRARAAIVAVGPQHVADLVEVPRPATRGLQTWWFAPDDEPAPSAFLRVDGRRDGPIANSAVMSRVAPWSAPDGRALVQASGVRHGDGAAEADVRRQLSRMWRADASRWEIVRRDDIPDALPAQTAPLRVRRPARVGERLYVAGDHRDTASIQGALVSGARVARAVLRDLP